MTQRRRSLLRAFVVSGLLMLPDALAAQERSSASTRPAEVTGDSIARLARSQIGRRYLFGGTDPGRGFDCSGFTRYLMRALNVQLPRTAAEQARVGQEVPRDPARLRPGDILTFGRGKRVTHVGIYIGNGRYVHASSVAGRIVETDLNRRSSSLVRAWTGVRRMLSGDSATAVAQR